MTAEPSQELRLLAASEKDVRDIARWARQVGCNNVAPVLEQAAARMQTVAAMMRGSGKATIARAIEGPRRRGRPRKAAT